MKPEITWMYDGKDNGYWVLLDGKRVHYTPDKYQCDLFAAELRGRLKMNEEWPERLIKNAWKMPIMEDAPTPAEKIRQARQELEDEVRESCLRFVERTGLAVTGISVDFMETTSIGKKFETSLQSVRVVIEDV